MAVAAAHVRSTCSQHRTFAQAVAAAHVHRRQTSTGRQLVSGPMACTGRTSAARGPQASAVVPAVDGGWVTAQAAAGKRQLKGEQFKFILNKGREHDKRAHATYDAAVTVCGRTAPTLAGAAITQIHTHTHTLISWQLGSGVAVAKAFAGCTQGRCEVTPSVQSSQDSYANCLGRGLSMSLVSEFVWGRAIPFCRSFRDAGPIELPATYQMRTSRSASSSRRMYCAAASGDDCDFQAS
jgi:hypothetical protein